MHHMMLVTLALAEASNSEEVRMQVFEALSSDTTFCGAGGRFGIPVCDWFVIGGRWSGVLAETAMGDDYRQAMTARFPELAANWWPHALADSHRQELDDLWQRHGGTGASPYTRDEFSEYGHADDAVVLTAGHYDALLRRFEGQAICGDEYDGQFLDLDDEPLTAEAIGRKWLVVVDYHN